MKNSEKKKLAIKLLDLWDEIEQHAGEYAAFSIACEQLGIDEDFGNEIIALLGSKELK